MLIDALANLSILSILSTQVTIFGPFSIIHTCLHYKRTLLVSFVDTAFCCMPVPNIRPIAQFFYGVCRHSLHKVTTCISTAYNIHPFESSKKHMINVMWKIANDMQIMRWHTYRRDLWDK